VAGAAAPGLAFGLALGCWANWIGQQLYGRPSALPWAVEITPAHRVPGYENYATFQPTFLYQCGWDVLTGLLVIWAARRFLLTGDRAFAVWLAAFAVGRYATEWLAIDFAPAPVRAPGQSVGHGTGVRRGSGLPVPDPGQAAGGGGGPGRPAGPVTVAAFRDPGRAGKYAPVAQSACNLRGNCRMSRRRLIIMPPAAGPTSSRPHACENA